jgi:hypothetical protein
VQCGVIIPLPVRVSKESSGNVPLAVKNANHLNAVLDRLEEDQVIPDWEHPQARREINTGLAYEGHGGQAVWSIREPSIRI